MTNDPKGPAEARRWVGIDDAGPLIDKPAGCYGRVYSWQSRCQR